MLTVLILKSAAQVYQDSEGRSYINEREIDGNMCITVSVETEDSPATVAIKLGLKPVKS